MRDGKNQSIFDQNKAKEDESQKQGDAQAREEQHEPKDGDELLTPRLQSLLESLLQLSHS